MFGAVTPQGNPAVFQVTANRQVIARERITLDDKCQSGNTLTLVVGSDEALTVSRKGTFSGSASAGPTTEPDGRIATFSDQVTGKFNKARTQFTVTWHNVTTVKDPATGMSDTCDSGTVSFTAID